MLRFIRREKKNEIRSDKIVNKHLKKSLWVLKSFDDMFSHLVAVLSRLIFLPFLQLDPLKQ